jgi:hypothetical protein
MSGASSNGASDPIRTLASRDSRLPVSASTGGAGAGRTPDYESGGQEFESLRARQSGIRYRHRRPPISPFGFVRRPIAIPVKCDAIKCTVTVIPYPFHSGIRWYIRVSFGLQY